MAVMVDGEVPEEVTPKDLILALISEIGTGGGQGHMVEYRGEACLLYTSDAADE